MELKPYDVPPMKDKFYPICHRCGNNANYGYELSKDRTQYIGPVCRKCAEMSVG
jgi:hypothetical protein